MLERSSHSTWMRKTLFRSRRAAQRVVLLSLIVGLTFSGGSAAVGTEEPFRIGLIPEMNVFDQVGRYQPLADYLSGAIGRPVELTMLSRYGNIVDRIRNHEVDAAFLGSFTGAMAAAQLDMVPIARPVNRDGTSTYFGQLFVRRGDGISSAEQMRGKRLALVERATTAGFIFPRAYLRAHGVADLDGYFSEVKFWGSHDASILAVLNGEADVGAAKNTIMDRLREGDQRIDAELEILAVSPRVPSNGLFIASTVSSTLRQKLKVLLLDLTPSSRGGGALESLGVQSFVETTSDDYEPVVSLSTEAGIDLANYEYVNQ